MQSKAATIAQYVAGLPPGERSVIRALDRIVRAAAPKGSGSMKYGMPTYDMAGRTIAFNAQRNYFSFYADPAIVRRHRAELGNLDVGKCCIRFRKIGDVSLDVLRKIAAASAGR
jgi:uncharacterized protein YdhG (YjbR/CyaY superfamily)